MSTTHEKLGVLVVDDHSDAAEILADYLRDSGFDARSATSGEQALSMAEGRAPECVLLDLRMPGMGGVETAQRLRRLFGGDITIVGMTGADSSSDDYRLMLSLCEHMLSKPIDLQRLKKVLRPGA